MANETDRFWDKVLKTPQRPDPLALPTPAQAAADLENASALPLVEQEIDCACPAGDAENLQGTFRSTT